MPEREKPNSLVWDFRRDSRDEFRVSCSVVGASGSTPASCHEDARYETPNAKHQTLISVQLHLRAEVLLVGGQEVSVTGRVHEIGAEVDALHVVLGDRHHLVEDVARLAHSEWAVVRLVPLMDEVIDAAIIVLDPPRAADQLPNLAILGLTRIANLDLELNAPQEGLVRELMRVEVGA